MSRMELHKGILTKINTGDLTIEEYCEKLCKECGYEIAYEGDTYAMTFNGELHYIPKDIFGGRVTFNKQVLRDEYIRKYCLNKKILLIEISYKMSIEEIKTIIQSLC